MCVYFLLSINCLFPWLLLTLTRFMFLTIPPFLAGEAVFSCALFPRWGVDGTCIVTRADHERSHVIPLSWKKRPVFTETCMCVSESFPAWLRSPPCSSRYDASWYFIAAGWGDEVNVHVGWCSGYSRPLLRDTCPPPSPFLWCGDLPWAITTRRGSMRANTLRVFPPDSRGCALCRMSGSLRCPFRALHTRCPHFQLLLVSQTQPLQVPPAAWEGTCISHSGCWKRVSSVFGRLLPCSWDAFGWAFMFRTMHFESDKESLSWTLENRAVIVSSAMTQPYVSKNTPSFPDIGNMSSFPL